MNLLKVHVWPPTVIHICFTMLPTAILSLTGQAHTCDNRVACTSTVLYGVHQIGLVWPEQVTQKASWVTTISIKLLDTPCTA